MTIKLYDYTAAPSPRRARILLAEKGLEVETVQVDIGAGEQLGEAFRKINPACTVPVLVLEDGTTITENDGIAAWAQMHKPDPSLFGTSAADAGMVWTWNSRIMFEGFSGVAEALRNSSPGMKGRATTGPNNYEQIPALAERGIAKIKAFMNVLDERLEGRDFIAIDEFSYADISALVFVDFSKWVKVRPEEGHTNLKRWHEAVSARPSATA